MASRVVTSLTDDLDGGAAERTVTFSLDDVEFDIDLSRSHRHEMIRDLARYMAAGRRVGGSGGPQPVYTQTKVDTRAVREWARGRGIDIPAGKRVPKDVVEQFRAAGN